MQNIYIMKFPFSDVHCDCFGSLQQANEANLPMSDPNLGKLKQLVFDAELSFQTQMQHNDEYRTWLSERAYRYQI